MVKMDGDSNFLIEDRFSMEYGLPSLDLLQNIKLLDAHHDDEGRIHVTIQRDLFTCDEEDIDVKSHQQYIICASGNLSEDGDMLYHGPNRATGRVNFMIDEASLFEQNLQPPPPNGTKTHLEEGLVLHGNLDTAVGPLPLDVQMTNVQLDSTSATSYRCRAFNISEPMKFTAYEGVWEEGKTESNGDRNEFLHHTLIYHCNRPSPGILSHSDGQPWDCMSQMPACDIVISYAVGTGLAELPSGVHLPLNAGLIVLQVHYENPFRKPVVNDSSGLRLWIEPPSVDSTNTKVAQLATHDGLFESLRIPADPKQKEVTLQMLISAEATKEYLPEEGVQAFGSVLHMHTRGIRGKVSLIRNGTHIMDVYNHQAYDFERQTADFTRWTFLPGDALIISCTYRPLIDRDVVGGLNTDDEMCQFYVGWAPAIPNFGRAMGVYVREGEPFKNTHMGNNITVSPRDLPYSEYKYAPTPKNSNDFVKLSDHRMNVCKLFVGEKLAVNAITYGDPAIYAQLVAIAAFVVVTLLSKRTLLGFLGIQNADLREQRNAVVYLGELLFSTVALPILCWDLASVFQEGTAQNGVDPNQHVLSRGLMMTQAMLYLLELFYRIDIRWSLVMHHLMTSCTVMYLFVVGFTNYQLLAFKFGMALIILAMSEQPLYIILLLRLTGFREAYTRIWPRLCHIACFIFLASRVIVVTLIVILLTQQAGSAEQAGSADIAWKLLDTSFPDWYMPSNPFFSNHKVVNAMLIVLLVTILFANYFAVAAMLHMARPSRRVEENHQSLSGVEATQDDEKSLSETVSAGPPRNSALDV
ncbi:Tyramine beta-hydroxylase [Seminavis robusta]|uniref:Tyramine beta-hydroxylase n=1 Tax=Seminavis robusta TaxID=568900 RepID=A0A9N8HND6_9STRA|nr:Tyramine beta-hydroxylase [Seminavis robusta]|eukprot:Sro812_g206040.1 Tyramine beta-hydroxylase (808) ;mRNA; f:12197-14620